MAKYPKYRQGIFKPINLNKFINNEKVAIYRSKL